MDAEIKSGDSIGECLELFMLILGHITETKPTKQYFLLYWLEQNESIRLWLKR